MHTHPILSWLLRLAYSSTIIAFAVWYIDRRLRSTLRAFQAAWKGGGR